MNVGRGIPPTENLYGSIVGQHAGNHSQNAAIFSGLDVIGASPKHRGDVPDRDPAQLNDVGHFLPFRDTAALSTRFG